MKNSVEIERKFVIKLPELSRLSEEPDYTVSEITQVYLVSAPGISRRIRKRVTDGIAVFTVTEKRRIDALSAYEDEREITFSEYSSLYSERDTDLSVIEKTRHTFRRGGQTYEIDVYPAWRRSCIMETELKDRDTPVLIPEFIELIKEVTGIKAYSNHSMAKHFPDELI